MSKKVVVYSQLRLNVLRTAAPSMIEYAND